MLSTGLRQVSIGPRSLLHNDYFVNFFGLEPTNSLGTSRTKQQVISQVILGTHSHNPFCCITSKGFHLFKNICELENMCPYLPPCHAGQRVRVYRNYSEEILSLPGSFTKVEPFCGERRTRNQLPPKQTVQVPHCTCGLRNELQQE